MLLPHIVNTIANRLNIDIANIRGGLTYHLLFNYLDTFKDKIQLWHYASSDLFDQYSTYFEFPLDENNSLLMISFLQNTGYIFFLKQNNTNVEFVSYHFFDGKIENYIFSAHSGYKDLLSSPPLRIADYWCFLSNFSSYMSGKKYFVEFAKLVFYALSDSFEKYKKYFSLLSRFRTRTTRKMLKLLLKDIFIGNNLTLCTERKNIIFSVRHVTRVDDSYVGGYRKNFFSYSKQDTSYRKGYVKYQVFHNKSGEQCSCIPEFIKNLEFDMFKKLDLLDFSISHLNIDDTVLFKIGDYLFLENYLFYYPTYSQLNTKSFVGFAKSYINNYQKYLLTEYCKRDKFEWVINDYFSSNCAFDDGFYEMSLLPFNHSIKNLDEILTLPDFCFDYCIFDKNDKGNSEYNWYKTRVSDTIRAENIEYRNTLSKFAIEIRSKTNDLIIKDDIVVI